MNELNSLKENKGIEEKEENKPSTQDSERLNELLKAYSLDELAEFTKRGIAIKSIASERQTTPNEIKSREYRGLRAMQRNARLRGFNCYSGTGLSSFLNSGESVQERYLIYNELRTC